MVEVTHDEVERQEDESAREEEQVRQQPLSQSVHGRRVQCPSFSNNFESMGIRWYERQCSIFGSTSI